MSENSKPKASLFVCTPMYGGLCNGMYTMGMMQASGVAAGVVETPEDLMEYDPQLKHRHFYWELDHPEVGKYRSPAPSFLLSKSSCELRCTPLLGEHNEYA